MITAAMEVVAVAVAAVAAPLGEETLLWAEEQEEASQASDLDWAEAATEIESDARGSTGRRIGASPLNSPPAVTSTMDVR